VNLHTVVQKLERLYPRYQWVPMREILEREGHLSMSARQVGQYLQPRNQT
jgi:hypothetical protein